MFVHEPQVKEVLAKVAGINKGALVITLQKQRDELTFKVVLGGKNSNKEEVSENLKNTFKDICRLKIDKIEFYQEGAIGLDAKALKDERKWA
jgi:hypothetical protein